MALPPIVVATEPVLLVRRILIAVAHLIAVAVTFALKQLILAQIIHARQAPQMIPPVLTPVPMVPAMEIATTIQIVVAAPPMVVTLSGIKISLNLTQPKKP